MVEGIKERNDCFSINGNLKQFGNDNWRNWVGSGVDPTESSDWSILKLTPMDKAPETQKEIQEEIHSFKKTSSHTQI